MEINSNISLFFQIFGLAHKSIFLDRLMIFAAQELIFVTYFLAFVLAILKTSREKKSFILTVLGIGFAEILIFSIHLLYNEPRPYVTYNFTPLIKHTPDAAFPSGHTTIMATAAWAFTFYKSKYAPLFLFLMLWVGVGRIFVGVHYPLDIVGGIITGLLAVSLAWLLKQRLKKIIF